MRNRSTQRDHAKAIQMFAPPDATLPAWVETAASRKTRSDKGKSQKETTWLNKLLSPFTKLIREAWPVGSVLLRRNNNGAWKRPDGSWLHYGLGQGTSDYIGFKSVIITTDMLGKRIAVFTAVEGKRDGVELGHYQSSFLKTVIENGGIGIVVKPENERDVVHRLLDGGMHPDRG
jgi:hypothetical protein